MVLLCSFTHPDPEDPDHPKIQSVLSFTTPDVVINFDCNGHLVKWSADVLFFCSFFFFLCVFLCEINKMRYKYEINFFFFICKLYLFIKHIIFTTYNVNIIRYSSSG